VVKNKDFLSHLVELIRLTATDLPGDVEEALRQAWEREEEGSPAKSALMTILENVKMARKDSLPLCQDTGVATFYVTLPHRLPSGPVVDLIRKAVREATRLSYLRPNAVDSLTEVNTSDNVGGETFPVLEFAYHEKPSIVVDLLLKGGGCENVSAQYTLPDMSLKAERDMEGVKKSILHAVFRAQGNGCPPGIVGVAVGGDRAKGYGAAKKALLRKIGEKPEKEEVAIWEEEIRKEANRLGIGPMGFGGRTTLLGVHLDFLHRHPASFFVSVSYMCWACRRRRLIWEGERGAFV